MISTDIRQRGFSKWYERELLRSHAHLILLVLCAVAVLGAAEGFSHGGDARLMMAGSMVAGAAIGVWAVRRYLFHLMRAEQVANQASCPNCGVYGRWRVEASEAGDSAAGRPEAMAVCCRRCGQHWRIEW